MRLQRRSWATRVGACGEAMNTIAKVALMAVIVAFLVLLVWGLWLQ